MPIRQMRTSLLVAAPCVCNKTKVSWSNPSQKKLLHQAALSTYTHTSPQTHANSHTHMYSCCKMFKFGEIEEIWEVQGKEGGVGSRELCATIERGAQACEGRVRGGGGWPPCAWAAATAAHTPWAQLWRLPLPQLWGPLA